MLHLLRDLFASFERHEVKYLVIGGIATVLHGVPRAMVSESALVTAAHSTRYTARPAVPPAT
jgi:hypothetical protein